MSLGTKRTCPKCEAKFYDLTKNPAQCPKCDVKTDFVALEKLALANAPKPKKKAPAPVKEPKVKVHLDETDEDIDLTPFADDDVEVAGEEEALEDVIEPGEEDIESLSDIEDREREEDLKNSDDGEEEAFIDGMENLETLIDLPEELEEDEEEEDDDEDEEER